MKRALVLAGLSGLLVSGLPPTVFAFPDVPSVHESRRAIEYLQAEGILQGYPDGRFGPAFTINRAELLKILVAGKDIEPSAEYRDCFPDVTDEWFAPYVCYAKFEGWVRGYPDGTFGPGRPVSFAEAVKMLVEVRGYPQAPADESRKRGIDPAAWFAGPLTTALLIDVVSYEQVWGDDAVPLQASLNRGFVAQMLYRSLMAEGLVRFPLGATECVADPTELEVKTFVDVLMPERVEIFRQEARAIAGNQSCVVATDMDPFARVTPSWDPYFLQPYPDGREKDEWTERMPLRNGRAILRGGTAEGRLRPEVFVLDLPAAELRQLPSMYAAPGGSVVTADGRYAVYVGVTGRTLEVVDFDGGTSVVLDAVQQPLTFLPSAEGGRTIALSGSGNVVAYAVYDATVPSGGGYAKLEPRTADIDAVFAPDPFPANP